MPTAIEMPLAKTRLCLTVMLVTLFYLACPESLWAGLIQRSTGETLELTAEQVTFIKNQPGIYYFESLPADISGGKLSYYETLRIPPTLGGGVIIGTPQGINSALKNAAALSTSASGAGSRGENAASVDTPEDSSQRELNRKYPRFDLQVALEKWAGDTTYQIGGLYQPAVGPSTSFHFPISELEFALDVYMASIGGGLQITDAWAFRANVGFNVTRDAGTMTDSDWLDNTEKLDVYSESDAELEALIIDLLLRYRFFSISRWSFFAGLGYKYQNFDYEVFDTVQSYPSGDYGTGTDYFDGKTLTYEVQYHIPFLEISTAFDITQKFHLQARFGYAPFVFANDEDNHLLRNKKNEGNTEGDALMAGAGLDYEFVRNWFLSLNYDYMNIETEGESDAYFFGVYDHTIDLEITSQQQVLTFAVRYLF